MIYLASVVFNGLVSSYEKSGWLGVGISILCLAGLCLAAALVFWLAMGLTTGSW